MSNLVDDASKVWSKNPGATGAGTFGGLRIFLNRDNVNKIISGEDPTQSLMKLDTLPDGYILNMPAEPQGGVQRGKNWMKPFRKINTM